MGDELWCLPFGDIGQVVASIRRHDTRGAAKEREPADICANYIDKPKPFLGYDVCLAAGSPIATGVIEGACRHLVRDRIDITVHRHHRRPRRSKRATPFLNGSFNTSKTTSFSKCLSLFHSSS